MRITPETTIDEIKRFLSIKPLYYISDKLAVEKIDTNKDFALLINAEETGIVFNDAAGIHGPLELYSDEKEAELQASIKRLGIIEKAREEQINNIKNLRSAIEAEATEDIPEFNWFAKNTFKWWVQFKPTEEILLLVRTLQNICKEPPIDSENRKALIHEAGRLIAQRILKVHKLYFVDAEHLHPVFLWWKTYKATIIKTTTSEDAPKAFNVDDLPKEHELTPEDEAAITKAVKPDTPTYGLNDYEAEYDL